MTAEQATDIQDRLFALEVLVMQMGTLMTARTNDPAEVTRFWQGGMDELVKREPMLPAETVDAIRAKYDLLVSSIEETAVEFRRIAAEAETTDA
ncbi:MAG: hypothetical protein OIF57_18235 [Marinobacterium sp.]|nr:hypothetical protein [Marinobacterium sp.]